jgi:hypothetical protein
MKIPAMMVVAATVLAFAFPQAPPVLAQETEIGAASRPFPLHSGSSPESDNRGQTVSEHPDGNKRFGDVSSEKNQTRIGKTCETTFRGHNVVIRSRSHRVVALNHSRHRLLIHRHGHRFGVLNEAQQRAMMGFGLVPRHSDFDSLVESFG